VWLLSKANLTPISNHIKLVQIDINYHAANVDQQHGTAEPLAVIKTICIAFFFLCSSSFFADPADIFCQWQQCSLFLEGISFYVGKFCILAPTATEDDMTRELHS
jgi:hypothetical protein